MRTSRVTGEGTRAGLSTPSPLCPACNTPMKGAQATEIKRLWMGPAEQRYRQPRRVHTECPEEEQVASN